MLPQYSTLLPTTQGQVQMQPYQEGTSSSFVQHKSVFRQQTKPDKEKIFLQPPFEGNIGMKLERRQSNWNSQNEVSKYQKYVSLPSPYATYKVEFDAFVLHINFIIFRSSISQMIQVLLMPILPNLNFFIFLFVSPTLHFNNSVMTEINNPMQHPTAYERTQVNSGKQTWRTTSSSTTSTPSLATFPPFPMFQVRNN